LEHNPDCCQTREDDPPSESHLTESVNLDLRA